MHMRTYGAEASLKDRICVAPVRCASMLSFTGCYSMRGGMAEWLKAAVLKTVVPRGTVGSNPTSSARQGMDL